MKGVLITCDKVEKLDPLRARELLLEIETLRNMLDRLQDKIFSGLKKNTNLSSIDNLEVSLKTSLKT